MEIWRQLRLRLHGIGYVQIRLGSDPLCLHETGSKLSHRITFISGPIWYQIADPIPTGCIRSRVNTRLIRTNFVPALNGSGPM